MHINKQIEETRGKLNMIIATKEIIKEDKEFIRIILYEVSLRF